MSSVSPASSASNAVSPSGLQPFDAAGSVALVLEQMRIAGATPQELAQVVQGYLSAYQQYVKGFPSATEVTSGSEVSARSTSSFPRGGSYVKSGYCYLKAVRPAQAHAVGKVLGSRPTFSRLASMPARVFRSRSDLEQLRVSRTAEGVFHLARGFAGDSFLDVMQSFSRGVIVDQSSFDVTLRAKLALPIDAYPELQGRYLETDVIGARGREWKDAVACHPVQVSVGDCHGSSLELSRRVGLLRDVLEAAPEAYDCWSMSGKSSGYVSTTDAGASQQRQALLQTLQDAGGVLARSIWGRVRVDFPSFGDAGGLSVRGALPDGDYTVYDWVVDLSDTSGGLRGEVASATFSGGEEVSSFSILIPVDAGFIAKTRGGTRRIKYGDAVEFATNWQRMEEDTIPVKITIRRGKVVAAELGDGRP